MGSQTEVIRQQRTDITLGVCEGEGVTCTGERGYVARVRQRYVADVGLVVGCPREVHLPGERSAVPDKTIATGAGIDDATRIAAADVDGVIAFTGLNRDILIGGGEDRAAVGDGFAAVATGIHHRTLHAVGGDVAAIGDGGNVFCQNG